MNDAYDLVAIGGRSAGLTAAIMSGRLGARILVVDKQRPAGAAFEAQAGADDSGDLSP